MPPVVLLHGFGMVSGCLSRLIQALSEQRFVMAFDLPGHGGSLDHPLSGSARKCAQAVIAELDIRATGPLTLVGHSFGGAVAALLAIERPDLVTRLILLAPGGFGPDINAEILRQHASATTAEDFKSIVSVMSGPNSPAPESLIKSLVAMRKKSNQTKALIDLSSRFLKGDTQGVLPLEILTATGIPVDLVWGELDRIVPVVDGMLAPAKFRKTIIAGAGHMLPDEATAQVARIILKPAATA